MNTFGEISETEMMNIAGGWDWGIVLGGSALVAATAPVSLPLLSSGALCAGSALGGAAIGYGATH